MRTSGQSRRGPDEAVTVGLLADPVAAPAQVAEQLAQDLPGLLSEQTDERRTWHMDVCREQLPPSDDGRTPILDIAGERMRQHGWDLAVCVTDLPLRSGKQPIVADLSNARRVVVVSLPAFGGVLLRRRVRGVVAQLIADLLDPRPVPETTEEYRRGRLPALSSRFRRITPEQPDVDIRILASRGGVRLLLGMVRDNRPWRLVFGLTGPLVGAFAFSAFYLINTSVWQLASAMGPLRLLAAAVGSIAVMVTWLIAYHHLWEPMLKSPATERQQALLFNASTVLTLTIGVGCMFAGLYAVNLLAALVVLAPDVFGHQLGHTPGFGDYAVVVVLVTAAATVAGAIGSGFESEDSVRQAAFSYREHERRQALRRERARRERQEEE